MVDKLNAQTWLEDNCKDKNTKGIIAGKDVELNGELTIDSYPNLETILLGSVKGGITKITIKNCPNITSILVNNHEITEIEGLGDLTKLQMLNIGNNKFDKIDLSKNTNLKTFIFYGNPQNLQFVNGIKNLVNLVNLNSDKTFSITKLLDQASEDDLKEIADKLKLTVDGKSKDEIKKDIIAEIEKNNLNKEKLNDPNNGIPGLLDNKGEIDAGKLAEIKRDAEDYQNLLKEPNNAPIKNQDGSRIDQTKLTEELQNAANFKEFAKNNPDLIKNDGKADQDAINNLKGGGNSKDNKALELALESYFGPDWKEDLKVDQYQQIIEINTIKN